LDFETMRRSISAQVAFVIAITLMLGSANVLGRDDTGIESLGCRTDARIDYDAELEALTGSGTAIRRYRITSEQGVIAARRLFRYRGPIQSQSPKSIVITAADGRRRRLDPADLGWGPADGKHNGIYHLDVVFETATVPGLEVGSTFEIETRTVFHRSHSIPLHVFGANDYLVPDDVYTLSYPARFDLGVEVVGDAGIASRVASSTRDEGDRVLRTWSCTDTGGADRAPYSSAPSAGRAWIVAHLSRTSDDAGLSSAFIAPDWKTASARYYASIEHLLAPDLHIRETASRITGMNASRRQAIAALYDHVQTKCTYLGLFEDRGGIMPEPATETHRLRTGDCKGLSIYLASLLRAAGIDAYPALVSTRGGVPVSMTVPNLAQFNHMITWVPGTGDGTFLDPTTNGFDVGLVPIGDLANPVLRLVPEGANPEMIDAGRKRIGDLIIHARGAVDGNGRLETDVEVRGTWLQNAGLNALMQQEGGAAPEQLVRQYFVPGTLTVDVFKAAASPGRRQGTPAVLTYRQRTCGALASTERFIFVPLELVAGRRPRLKADERSTDVDLGLVPGRRERWAVRIPGIKTATAVAPDLLEGHGVRWRQDITVENDSLIVTRALTFDPVVLPQTETAAVQEILDAVGAMSGGYIQVSTTP